MYSVITPIYRNAESIPALISEFENIAVVVQRRFGIPTEFVFVVDRSPDESYERLEEALPRAKLHSQLILHSRNFGSFAAIRTGLRYARGDYVGIISADLQEPPSILVSFLEAMLKVPCDVAIGVRQGRDDPAVSRLAANLFWRIYRRLVVKEISPGGVDIFGCNRKVRDELLKLEEAHSSLLAQIFWLGFRRTEIGYKRIARTYGKSAWTFRKKINYLLDSIFAFTDLPIRILTLIGIVGTCFACLFGILIIVFRLTGQFHVPGYATTMAVIMFFGALNILGLGLVGAYTWRGYENTKRRPLSVVQSARVCDGSSGILVQYEGNDGTERQQSRLGA